MDSCCKFDQQRYLLRIDQILAGLVIFIESVPTRPHLNSCIRRVADPGFNAPFTVCVVGREVFFCCPFFCGGESNEEKKRERGKLSPDFVL